MRVRLPLPLPLAIAVLGALCACTSPGFTPGSAASAAGAPPSTVFDRARTSTSYSVLHSFGGPGDGANPWAGLIAYGGTLYGTTSAGGASNAGTVYSLSSGGAETVLHSFSRSFDGYKPTASLVGLGGVLYGTTYDGGSAGGGTIFSITPSGTEHVIYSFGSVANDGLNPRAGLVTAGNAFYGTTEYGGARGAGTVFKLAFTGVESVMHTFGAGADGQFPIANLTPIGNLLYGVTVYGGRDGGSSYGGVAFTLSGAGTETILHNFGSTHDADDPGSSLVDIDGTLYGTSVYGGQYGDGVVFTIAPNGSSEKVIHSFGAPGDGSEPIAALTLVNGLLYGTTYAGGTNGVGTIFSITRGGTETVLHSFAKGTADGNSPAGDLIAIGNTLIGTTDFGGVHHAGTIFSFTP